MDDTKKPLGAVTMVYEDYFFLERWYDHYRRQVGAENLYVFSHGNDPRHREIADGANVMNVPRDPSMQKFDRRRWRMMGLFASGMLEFYRWMVVSDVDEILVLDPRAGDSIPGYLAANYGDPRKSPRNLSPLGLELFHLPGEEPLPIAPDETILSRRRIFRPSRNYSKPCLIGAPAIFGPGGHRNNLGPRHMPEDLYLIHLKFFDHATLAARAEEKGRIITQARALNPGIRENHSFSKTLAGYHGFLETATLTDEGLELPEFRAAMMKQTEKYANQFVWGPATTTNLYRLPERFASVF